MIFFVGVLLIEIFFFFVKYLGAYFVINMSQLGVPRSNCYIKQTQINEYMGNSKF